MKRVRKFALAASFAMLASLFFSMATALPANADQSDCPDGYFCLWEHGDYQGLILTPSASPEGNPNFGWRSFNDVASSGWNRTGTTWCVFDDINYGGALLYIFPPGTYIAAVSPNDKASSARPC